MGADLQYMYEVFQVTFNLLLAFWTTLEAPVITKMSKGLLQ